MPSLEDIPQYLADYWGINLVSSQAILSTIVILSVLIPVLILTRGRGVLIPAVTLFIVEVLLVGITWLDGWIMLITVVLIVLLFANDVSDRLGG